MLRVPKNMLVDSFTYEEFDGVDRNHTPKYKKPIKVKNVRIDRTRKYYRDSEESAVKAEATILCYQKGTQPFLNFKEQSKVHFDDTDYTIQHIKTHVEVYSSEIAAITLEVI